MKKNLLIGATLLTLFTVFGLGQAALDRTAAAQQREGVMAPRFEVDPLWPKPLPNHWLLGSAIGVAVDADDHIWIIHRSSATLAANEKALEAGQAECCAGAPPVLEFDQAGNLLRHWGGPGEGYEWPDSNHGILIDYKGNVWIGGNGAPDSHLLKFTKDGKFLLQAGVKGARRAGPKPGTDPSYAVGEGAGYVGGSNDGVSFGRVAKIFVDPRENEAYISDGYLNKRVAVIDMTTGRIKRIWGAYGNVPSDTNYGPYHPDSALIPQFRTPMHCAEPTNDGLVYVCDRPNDRIQVFQKDGKFVKEVRIAPKTLGDGSVWDIAFSKDPAQKYLYLADGKNEKIYVMDRQSLEILTQFGEGGRQPGQWFAVHSIATDSRGNIFTTETYEGKRLQKFVYKGIAKVPKYQGVVWPKK